MTKIKFTKSLKLAFKGIIAGIINERNINIQIAIGIFIIFLSLLLRIPKLQFILILVVSFLVIILELTNTVIEKIIDKVCPHYDKEFGLIKDIMAGVVLLSVILAIIVGIFILFEPLFFCLINA